MLESLDVLDESLNRADEAMYGAKATGRDRVVTLEVLADSRSAPGLA